MPDPDAPLPRAATFDGGSTSGRTSWDHEQVRVAWTALARRVAQVAAGAGALLLVLIVVIVVVDRRDEAFLRDARTAQAQVDGRTSGGKYSQDSIAVSYVVDGRPYRATIKGDGLVADRGQTITVYYAPEAPRDVRTADAADHSTLATLGVTILTIASGLVLLDSIRAAVAAGLVRRRLRRHAPREVALRSATTTRARTDITYVQITAGDLDVVGRLQPFSGTRRFDLTPIDGVLQGPALASPGPSRLHVVLIDPDVERPALVRLPRTHRQARRWRALLADDLAH